MRRILVGEKVKDRTGIVEVFEDAAGEGRWRVKALNGEIVLPGESHPGGERDALRAFRTARRCLERPEVYRIVLEGEEQLPENTLPV